MSLSDFLAGTLVEADIQALGFEDSDDCEVVVTLEGGRVNPDGPYTLVPTDDLTEALAGEDTMFLTNVREYHHQFQRANGVVASRAPQALRETYFGDFIAATNTRLVRRGGRRKFARDV